MNVQTIALDQIAWNPLNIRRDVGDVTELADSIRSIGLLQPLVVAPHPIPADTKVISGSWSPWVLIAGHRRLTACEQAGLTEATCVVREDLAGDASQIEAMLVENLQRGDITPVEEGQAYKQLLAFDGISVADIAKKTGRSAATVKSRVVLAGLPDKVQTGVHDGSVTLADAMVLAEFTGDLDATKQLERDLGTSNFDYTAAQLRRARKAQAAVAKTTKDLAKAGVPIVEKPQGFPWGGQARPIAASRGANLQVLDGDTVRDLAVDEHASCEGHAAVIDSYDGEVLHLCTDPAKFHAEQLDAIDAFEASRPDAKPARLDYQSIQEAKALGFDPNKLTPEQRATLANRMAEKDRIRKVLDDVETVRFAHLNPAIKGETKAPKDVLGLYLALTALADGEEENICEALHWIPTADADDDDYHDWFITQCLTAKPDVLLRGLLYLLRDRGEYGFGTYHEDWTSPSTRAYFAFLERAGYPITPEETARISPATGDEAAA